MAAEPTNTTFPNAGPRPDRRAVLKLSAALGAALVLGPTAAWAAYPDKPVRIVVPLAAGGPTDVLARLLAEAMTPILGQQVIVENRTGASGQIAVDYVARAAPDGYTLLMATLGTVILPQTNAGFDAATLDKLQPVSKVEGRPVYLVAPSSLPANDIAELLAYAKANPGKVRYGAQGASDILGIGNLNKLAGVDIQVVRYQGGAPAVQAVVAGQVELRSPRRARRAVREVGRHEGDRRDLAGAAEGSAARAGDRRGRAGLRLHKLDRHRRARHAEEAVDTIADAMRKALSEEKVVERLHELGTSPSPSTPEEFTDFFKAEIKKWADVAAAIGFTPQ